MIERDITLKEIKSKPDATYVRGDLCRSAVTFRESDSSQLVDDANLEELASHGFCRTDIGGGMVEFDLMRGEPVQALSKAERIKHIVSKLLGESHTVLFVPIGGNKSE